MTGILEEPLFRALIDGSIPFFEVMNTFNIRVSIGSLPSPVAGFTYLSRKGYYHLILNGDISYKAQRRTFIHEIKHITSDIPKVSYFVGLDMQRCPFEIDADRVAEAVGQYVACR